MVPHPNFNPRPPCGGRPHLPEANQVVDDISIHAPRVGGDVVTLNILTPKTISIHAPRVGGDVLFRCNHLLVQVFQSTPPVWGATGLDTDMDIVYDISIHAPRVGGRPS